MANEVTGKLGLALAVDMTPPFTAPDGARYPNKRVY